MYSNGVRVTSTPIFDLYTFLMGIGIDVTLPPLEYIAYFGLFKNIKFCIVVLNFKLRVLVCKKAV
jgi:hypothetical protein